MEVTYPIQLSEREIAVILEALANVQGPPWVVINPVMASINRQANEARAKAQAENEAGGAPAAD